MLFRSWEEMFQNLLKFKKEYGDCDVPARWKENPQLGRWVGKQRTAYKEGILNKEKVEKLEGLEFIWDSFGTQWEAMFPILEEYRERHGDCLVPARWKENPQLSNWVNVQRTAYNKGTLSNEKINRLEELGFIWDTHDALWEERYQELVVYKQEHGDCLVPKVYPENQQLAGWVGTQRQSYRKDKLSQDRVKRLEGIGFAWDTRKRK